MSAFSPILPIAIGLALLVAAAATILVLRVVRARKRVRRRVVEQPNSHYTPQFVKDSETRHRWENIALDRVHEVNRDEVLRLIAKAEATGVAALRPSERVFLDNIADLTEGTPPPEPRERTRQIAPDLRHRPA